MGAVNETDCRAQRGEISFKTISPFKKRPSVHLRNGSVNEVNFGHVISFMEMKNNMAN